MPAFTLELEEHPNQSFASAADIERAIQMNHESAKEIRQQIFCGKTNSNPSHAAKS